MPSSRFATHTMSFLFWWLLAMPSALAFPDLATNYYERGSLEERSPCHAMNTMANHGILPRDGKGVDGLVMMDHMESIFGVPFQMLAGEYYRLISEGLRVYMDANGTQVFDLFDLHLFDQDASFVRHDNLQNFLVGDTENYEPAPINMTLYNDMVSLSKTIPGILTAPELAQHQYNRILYARRNNPDLDQTKVLQRLPQDATLLYASLAYDHELGGIPLPFLETFLVEEKFHPDYVPFYERGVNITEMAANPMVAQLGQFFAERVMEAFMVDLAVDDSSNTTVAGNSSSTSGLEEENNDVSMTISAEDEEEGATATTTVSKQETSNTPVEAKEEEDAEEAQEANVKSDLLESTAPKMAPASFLLLAAATTVVAVFL